jgi:hypothetical protein
MKAMNNIRAGFYASVVGASITSIVFVLVPIPSAWLYGVLPVVVLCLVLGGLGSDRIATLYLKSIIQSWVKIRRNEDSARSCIPPEPKETAKSQTYPNSSCSNLSRSTSLSKKDPDSQKNPLNDSTTISPVTDTNRNPGDPNEGSLTSVTAKKVAFASSLSGRVPASEYNTHSRFDTIKGFHLHEVSSLEVLNMVKERSGKSQDKVFNSPLHVEPCTLLTFEFKPHT